MLNWQNTSEYKNASRSGVITNEPEVLLWHPRTGPVLGRMMQWNNTGEVVFSAGNYHGFDFTKFARINVPELE